MRWHQTSNNTPDMSCTKDGSTFKNRILLACVILIFPHNALSKVCTTGQKLRFNQQGVQICCNTVKCGKSQQFYYCQLDGESDVCRNCMNNGYTNDPIDTSQWPYHDNGKYQAEPIICVSPPSCEAEGVVLVGRECQCNLNGGYWGTDQYNCQLYKDDKQNCRIAGVQLTLEGKCVPCSGDTFKKEDDKYGQCVNKTVCKSHEQEISSGSSTSDRTCEKLPTERPPISTAPPDTSTTSRPVKEGDNSISDGVVAVIVLIVIGLIIAILVILYRKNKTFADCCGSFVEIVQRNFQKLACRQSASKKPEEHEMVGNEPEESPTVETRLLIEDETNLNNYMNGVPPSNSTVGSDGDYHNKHTDLDPTETNLKSFTQDEGEHLSSSEKETVPKSVINKKEKIVSNIPSTDKEAQPGQSQDSIGCRSLPSSIYGNRSGSGGDLDTNTSLFFSGSGHEADRSSSSSQYVPSESNPNITTPLSANETPSTANETLSSVNETPSSVNETPSSVNETSESTGNMLNSSLIDNLDTIPETPNNDGSKNKKAPEFVKSENPPVAFVVPVTPTPRSPATDQVNPILRQSDNRQNPDSQSSNTTASGNDIETATNDENFKVAPSFSNRPAQDPLTVRLPDKHQDESLSVVGNQGRNEPSVTSGSAPSESGSQPPNRSSSENRTQPLRSSGTTESGQPLGAPESDNSQGSAPTSIEDDPQENIEVTSRTIANSRTRPV